jgi:hypothetical protein
MSRSIFLSSFQTFSKCTLHSLFTYLSQKAVINLVKAPRPLCFCEVVMILILFAWVAGSLGTYTLAYSSNTSYLLCVDTLPLFPSSSHICCWLSVLMLVEFISSPGRLPDHHSMWEFGAPVVPYVGPPGHPHLGAQLLLVLHLVCCPRWANSAPLVGTEVRIFAC